MRNKEKLNKFYDWIENNSIKSYDQYDFWASKYGIFSKKVYYRSKLLGSPFVASIFILDIIFPWTRKIFFKKKNVFPIATAHLILGYLNRFKNTNEKKYLEIAINKSNQLIEESIKTQSGIAWGYPFHWMTTRGLLESGVPLITTTPYCLEAFIELYKITKDEKYKEIILNIYNFCKNDLGLSKYKEFTSSSYSTLDNSIIVNASAYRAYSLILSGVFFKDDEGIRIGKELIKFVIGVQNSDGSWYYGFDHPNDRFIDNFHTCFVLKNLIKSNNLIHNKDVEKSIENGLKYYFNNLYDGEITIPFSHNSRFQFVKVELYDVAEFLNLLMLFYNNKTYNIELKKVLNKIFNDFYLEPGYFTTRKYKFFGSNKIPYLRWPQAQLFNYISNIDLICVELLEQ